MVVAVQLDHAREATVAEAATASYAARGRRVLEIPLIEMVHVSVGADVASMRSIVSVEDRTVELVVDGDPFEAIAPAVWALAARGWEVVALAPCGRNGEAHRALRGTPCRIQPWWLEEDGVHFGSHEQP